MAGGVGRSAKGALLLLGSRISILAAAAAGSLLGFNPGLTGEWNIQFPLLGGFARWDSAYYLDISKFGYPGLSSLAANPGAISLYAFRPVYPFVLWLLRPLFGWMYVDNAELLAGFLWNLLMLVLAGVFLERLTRRLFGEKVAWRTIVLLAIFPTSYIFSAIYPSPHSSSFPLPACTTRRREASPWPPSSASSPGSRAPKAS